MYYFLPFPANGSFEHRNLYIIYTDKFANNYYVSEIFIFITNTNKNSVFIWRLFSFLFDVVCLDYYYYLKKNATLKRICTIVQ